MFAREVLFEGLTPDVLQQWDDNLRYYLAKLVAREPQRRLLLKSPAHSARIPRLRRLFPAAKFIHIHRDPRAVVKSTGKMFRKTWQLVALQDWDDDTLDSFIPWAYSQVMDRLFAGLQELPVRDLVEVRYDDLVREPTATVERIYHALDLGGFERVRPLIDAFVEEASAIRADTQIDAESDASIARVLASYMARLGYEAGLASPEREDGARGCMAG